MKCCVKHVIFLLEIVSAQIRKALYGSTGSEKHDQNHYREVIVREVRKGSYNHQSCWEEQVGLELDMEEWVGLR